MSSTPTLVAIYQHLGTKWERVAEFRLTTATSVELNLLGHTPCPLAQHWYNDGIDLPASTRDILPAHGPEFMRALLTPFHMSYYRIVDESPRHPPHER